MKGLGCSKEGYDALLSAAGEGGLALRKYFKVQMLWRNLGSGLLLFGLHTTLSAVSITQAPGKSQRQIHSQVGSPFDIPDPLAGNLGRLLKPLNP